MFFSRQKRNNSNADVCKIVVGRNVTANKDSTQSLIKMPGKSFHVTT